jgi:hypothetical protein
MKQQISREESRRLHSEFEKFYAVHPEYRVQANHGQWIEIANENGGTETLSKEQMELWLSDPSLRNRLAKLKTIPADDLNSFLVTGCRLIIRSRKTSKRNKSKRSAPP